MALAIPTPILLIGSSAILTALQLFFFPGVFPDLPIRRRFFVFAAVSSALLASWNLYIYPAFLVRSGICLDLRYESLL
jgi:hypothetical protein